MKKKENIIETKVYRKGKIIEKKVNGKENIGVKVCWKDNIIEKEYGNKIWSELDFL